MMMTTETMVMSYTISYSVVLMMIMMKLWWNYGEYDVCGDGDADGDADADDDRIVSLDSDGKNGQHRSVGDGQLCNWKTTQWSSSMMTVMISDHNNYEWH